MAPSFDRYGAAKRRMARKAPPPVEVFGDSGLLDGSVKSVVFRNEDTGYTVLRVVPVSTSASRFSAEPQEASVVGKCAVVWEGEEIHAEGAWENDNAHGRQFRASSIVCVVPKSIEGIRRYLASGLIKGIGKVNAGRIVEHFGERTLEILDTRTDALREVPGIGIKRAREIGKAWRDQREMREVMIFTQTYGITVNQTSRIYRRYGSDTIALIKADPYRLCREIRGIGFLTADRIAMSVGLPKDSILRARAAIIHTLRTEADDGGHCWTQDVDLLLHAQELVGISVETLAQALKDEEEAGRVAVRGGKVYLKDLLLAECRTAQSLRDLAGAPAAFRPIDPEKAIPWAERESGLVLAPAQTVAVTSVLKSKVSVITGGPGVGKTTVIRTLVAIFKARRLKVRLAAPTGRAAKRMGESTGAEAQTLHRLLKYNPQTNEFTYNETKRMEGDVFIFDEMSMLDIELASDLLAAIPPSAVVIFVGDTDQLPSVGPGNVLRDMISSGEIPVARLTEIFRQDNSGLIVRNAHRVNEGLPFETREGESDFYFVPQEDPAKALALALDFMTNRIPAHFGMDPLKDVQILTPMRRNILGADNINQVVQERLNPGGPEVRRGASAFRKGDRVMQLRNNYDKDVYNGDVGFVSSVDTESRSVTVSFDSRDVEYKPGDLEEIALSYACTVHKSQGSEYPAVIVLLHNQHYMLLQRNLLYTAITRGRRLVLVIASRYAVGQAVKTNDVRERRTGLAARIRGEEP